MKWIIRKGCFLSGYLADVSRKTRVTVLQACCVSFSKKTIDESGVDLLLFKNIES